MTATRQKATIPAFQAHALPEWQLLVAEDANDRVRQAGARENQDALTTHTDGQEKPYGRIRIATLTEF